MGSAGGGAKSGGSAGLDEKAATPTTATGADRGTSARHGAWFLLFVLTAVNAINWADRQVVPILFPGMRDDLGLSDTELGIIGGVAFSLIYAMSSFVFGRAADRGIRKYIIAFGLCVWSVATAAGALAGGFGSLFAARFFTGVGEASLYPAAMSLIAERFQAARRGRAMGIFGAAAALGGGLGVALGGALAESIGWRQVFLIYGAVGLLFLPLILSVPEKPREVVGGDGERVKAVIGKLARDRRLLSIWIAGMVMIASGVGYAAWVPSLFVRERELDVAGAGALFGLATMVGGVVGALLGGIMADRARKRRVAGELDVSAVAALLAAPLAAGTVTAHWPPAFIFFGLLAPVVIFAFFPALQTVIVEIVPPHQHGLAYAINILFLGGMGTALGPFLVGVVSDATGSLNDAIFVTIAGMALSSLLIANAGRVVRAHASHES